MGVGLSDEVRNDHQQTKIASSSPGGRPGEAAQSLSSSHVAAAVFGVLTNGVPVSIEVSTD